VGVPAFFKQVNAALASEPLANWKTYLRFHVADSFRAISIGELRTGKFRVLPEVSARGKRKAAAVEALRAIHRLHAGRSAGTGLRAQSIFARAEASTVDMVRRIEDAMAKRIQQLDWMSPETKQQALVKLQGIRNKIGYPDRWRD